MSCGEGDEHIYIKTHDFVMKPLKAINYDCKIVHVKHT